MYASSLPRRRGFALMEAMIAIVVVGIGLFGIARLNSVMLAGTAIGKTRAEATQLAEGKLEEIRAQQPPAAKPVSSTSPETLTGVNATFTRSWTIASAGLTGLDLDRVTVCVSWGDTCGGTGERKVEINSLLAWTNLGTSGSVGSGQGGAGGGMPETPPGKGREGGDAEGEGNNYNAGSPPAGSVSNANDGTSDYVRDDGKRELIETATGRVLLTIDDGSAFSTISGKVFITWGSAIDRKDEDQIDMAVINANVRVLGSGGSVCRQYIPGDGNTLPRYPASGTTQYSYFHYTCYVGGGWWGNIAVVRFDGGDRVCLGDPLIPQSETSAVSRRPFLNPLRNYRGYTSACTSSPTDATCKSTGIGMGGSVYSAVNFGSSVTGIQHHFLLTTIKGQPSNADCANKEGLPTLAENPFTTISGTQGGNAGLLFCLSSTCPFESGFVTYETAFVMTINTTATTAPLVNVDGGRCVAPTQTTSPFVYDCRIDWTGWSGDYWSGEINFLKADGVTKAGQISGVTTSAIQPTGKVVTLGGASGVGCEGKCISFASVPKDVTSFALSATFTPLP